MLLFFALNILIITYINSNATEKKNFINIDIYNSLQKADKSNSISSENLTILNYHNITSLITLENQKHTNEKENKENSKITFSNTKASSNIRLFTEEDKITQEQINNNNNNYNFLSNQIPSLQTNTLQLRFLQKFTCINSTLSCSGHGECTADKQDCICEAAYTTLENQSTPEANKRCNYERKTQLKAFLFELFLGFGAGHFYTERYTMASLKLSAFIFGIFIICLFPITAKFLSEKLESDCLVLSVSCFYYLCSIGLAFWFIYDLVMFGMNKYLDGNQIQLLSWSKNPELQH